MHCRRRQSIRDDQHHIPISALQPIGRFSIQPPPQIRMPKIRRPIASRAPQHDSIERVRIEGMMHRIARPRMRKLKREQLLRRQTVPSPPQRDPRGGQFPKLGPAIDSHLCGPLRLCVSARTLQRISSKGAEIRKGSPIRPSIHFSNSGAGRSFSMDLKYSAS